MLKSSRKTGYLAAGIAAVIVLSGILLYPSLPEKMASHWNLRGEADGYMPKIYGVFLMPVFYLFLLALLIALPRIDPLKENIGKFRKYYNGLMIMLFLFFFYIHALTIAWNLGMRFDMTRMIIPAFSILFFYLGIVMERSERNWFIGFRTPWTLTSDEVWKKTHELGGKLFRLIGMVAFLGIFIGSSAMIFAIILAVISSLYLFIYSYLEYRKIDKREKNG
ncbi:MAG: SdpI family protein [Candidatus Paceibacterota bacterium]|jgi:uncharacterized membrane protein